MSNLPDRTRPRLTLPGRSLADSVARAASAAMWRALHPASRERFLEAPRPAAAQRRYYEADDGWRAPLLRLDPAPGGAGEPVLLAHGLGAGPDAFRYGTDSLAGALRQAGYTVYLLCHRADLDSIPPEGPGRAAVSVEDIVERDLPAALAQAAADSGFSRVHAIGHGLGGLLLLAAAARRDARLASVCAVGAPLRLPQVRSEARIATVALSLAPARWRLPLAAAARIGLPLVDEELCGATPPPRARGALAYAVSDPPLALLRSLSTWIRAGSPSLYGGIVSLEGQLADARVPLLVVTGTEDALCSCSAGERAVSAWGHEDRRAVRAVGLGHLDLLLGAAAPERVFVPILEWLETRRRAAWGQERAVG